jgi:hypothetical protein
MMKALSAHNKRRDDFIDLLDRLLTQATLPSGRHS